MSSNCRNCEAPLTGRFCSECGQEDVQVVAPLWEVLQHLAEDLFKFDTRIWRSVGALLIRPGFLTGEYLAGRRVRYVAPFKLYLAAIALWVLVFVVTGGERLVQEAIVGDAVAGGASDGGISAAETEKLQRFATGAVANQNLIALLLAPLFAGVLKVIYTGSGRYYVEHLVFSVHCHAFACVLWAAVTPFQVLFPAFEGAGDWISMLVPAGYTLAAMHRVYGEGVGRTLGRFALLAGAYGCTVAALLLAAMVLYLALA